MLPDLRGLRPAERLIVAICQLRDRRGKLINMTANGDLGHVLLTKDGDFYAEQLMKALADAA